MCVGWKWEEQQPQHTPKRFDPVEPIQKCFYVYLLMWSTHTHTHYRISTTTIVGNVFIFCFFFGEFLNDRLQADITFPIKRTKTKKKKKFAKNYYLLLRWAYYVGRGEQVNGSDRICTGAQAEIITFFPELLLHGPVNKKWLILLDMLQFTLDKYTIVAIRLDAKFYWKE